MFLEMFAQKAVQERVDPQEKTGGLHLMLRPMDLLTNLVAHLGLTVDGTVILLRMVMQTWAQMAAAAPQLGCLRHRRNLVHPIDIRQGLIPIDHSCILE